MRSQLHFTDRSVIRGLAVVWYDAHRLSRDGINSCVQVLSLLSNPSLLEADELLACICEVVVFSPSFHSWILLACFPMFSNVSVFSSIMPRCHLTVSCDLNIAANKAPAFPTPWKHPGPQVASGRIFHCSNG